MDSFIRINIRLIKKITFFHLHNITTRGGAREEREGIKTKKAKHNNSKTKKHPKNTQQPTAALIHSSTTLCVTRILLHCCQGCSTVKLREHKNESGYFSVIYMYKESNI